MPGDSTVAVRRFEPDDEPAVLELLRASLGWLPDERYVRFFAWKHRENPFGASPAWVATDDDRVVGFRTFMRWEFEVDGATVPAVRAVDTATHPDHQGRGIFSQLTRHALDGLLAEGVAFVFNTPNQRSAPGYLTMGWQPVARLPLLARPRSIGALARVARARTPADKWSVQSSAGEAADKVLADQVAVSALLASLPAGGLRTRRTPRYLAWRYGFGPLQYRAVTSGASGSGGMVIFRLRRRGAALEAAVCEELVPGHDAATTRNLLRRVLRESRADHAVRVAGDAPRAGFLPMPGQGPQLVWRGVGQSEMPEPASWKLTLGDVELF
ncbi:MAG: GNAT family N-acetyltransferase [Jiangellaceae bacterium]